MPLFYCCPCMNVRISCRSVSNNLPPFATEMAVARRAFEQGGAKPTPSAIAKLSVAGLSTEHAKLVRFSTIPAVNRWKIVHCLLCNTRVASMCSGSTSIVNSALAITEMDLENKLKDPRYCSAFRVLVVQRSKSKSKRLRARSELNNTVQANEVSPALSADSAALAVVDSEMVSTLNLMANSFVASQELEAKRRVEVYYNEEQAKLRSMHNCLKSQMESLTKQILKVLTAEKQYQKEERSRLASSSGDEGGASASATSLASSPASHAYPSPEMVGKVIRVPASPIMKNVKTNAVDAAAEQETRDRFTAPRLEELDTHGSDLDSPMDLPLDPDSGTMKAIGRANTQNSLGTDVSSVGSTPGKSSEDDGFEKSSESHSSKASSTVRSSSGAENFALTPPAVVVGSLGSTSINFRNSPNSVQQPRGLRMRMGVERTDSEQGAPLSTTAPARSDSGFAFFVKKEVDNLFEMDDEVGEEYGRSKTILGRALPTVSEETSKGDSEDEQGTKKARNGEIYNTNGMAMKINWAPKPETKQVMMSQSYAHPTTSDWWEGAEDLTDSSDEEIDEEQDIFEEGQSDIYDSLESKDKIPSGVKQNNDALYGSSLPVAIPSMGGRAQSRRY